MENTDMNLKKIQKLMEQERRDYYRSWRKKNPDKVRQHNQNYWRKRVEKRLAVQKEKGE